MNIEEFGNSLATDHDIARNTRRCPACFEKIDEHDGDIISCIEDYSKKRQQRRENFALALKEYNGNL